MVVAMAVGGCASSGSETESDSPRQAPEAAVEQHDAEPEVAGSTAVTDPHGSVAGQIRDVLDGEHRSDANAARDEYRNPLETLLFFGIEADMNVVEIWPGLGWYTEVLAPLVAEEGSLRVGLYATKDGDPDHRPTQVTEKYLAMVDNNRDVLGEFEMGTFAPPEHIELGEPESADVILSIRNLHLLHRDGRLPDAAEAYFEVLRPGGTLGIIQHRAPEGSDPDETAQRGYLPEAFVIEQFEAVGFELRERTEINANPDDTADHPNGVWTLPPVLNVGDEDPQPYKAIGESDRMTLRFVRPLEEANCDRLEDGAARTDCIAEEALANRELTERQRRELCREAPFPLRCDFLIVLADEDASLCDAESFLGDGNQSSYGPECYFLEAIDDGDLQDCEQILATGEPRKSPFDPTAFCERIAFAGDKLDITLSVDELPAAGDGLHELLAPYYLATTYEEHQRRLQRGEYLYDEDRSVWDSEDHQKWYCGGVSPGVPDSLLRMDEINPALVEQFIDDFAETFGRDVNFYIHFKSFDPETWEGLEEMLSSGIRLYTIGHTAHRPSSALTFVDDGTYHRRDYQLPAEPPSVTGPHHFNITEGSWKIVSAQPGERWAVIALDGEEFYFGRSDRNEQLFVLHTEDDIYDDTSGGLMRYRYITEEYSGEC